MKPKNKIDVIGDIAIITLSYEGFALIDADQVTRVIQYKWRKDIISGYAVASLPQHGGQPARNIYLSDFVTPEKDNLRCQLKDRLDCRRESLKRASYSEILSNRHFNTIRNNTGLKYIYKKKDGYQLQRSTPNGIEYGGSSTDINKLLPLQQLWLEELESKRNA